MMMTTAVAAVTDTGWPLTTVVPRNKPPVGLPGEATAAAGLVIVPHADTVSRHYTGLWSVIHTGTGYHVGPNAVPLVYAREAARLLADTGVDWTAPRHVIADPARGLIRVVGEIRERVLFAWDEGIPTWWARDSWTHMRPAWQVHFADDGPCHYEDTWTSLVTWLNAYQALPQHDTDPLYGGITRITREPTATWRLACAAPLCEHHSVIPGTAAVLDCVLTDDGEDGYQIRHPERATTAREARGLGWTRHDHRHWTCPACSSAHAPDPDTGYGC